MIRRLLVTFVLMFSGASLASDLIMCSAGRVKTGDSYDQVLKAKCGQNLGNSGGMRILDGQKIRHKILKMRFSDGGKAAFFFINDKLIDVVVFD
ncbi:hypothetical protein [Vibrio sp. 3-2(1)]|uniref:hypothetical protein n=1 Tax=Vibrio sp. 3-2(1) TaxID=2591016 RepID=UPI0014826FA0|nr:hypothetical protein [Vibrio sp. 3-2(1)]NNN70859.1 hypothetical protein [Vibrio sp. 3-2(1)]